MMLLATIHAGIVVPLALLIAAAAYLEDIDHEQV